MSDEAPPDHLTLDELTGEIDRVATESGLDGVVRIDDGDATVLDRAYGLAHRAHRIPNTPATRFAMASGSKTFTALAIVRLVQDGRLALDTKARDVLGDDLPLIPDDVTVEHLLTHRSGIGDYLDEDELDDDNDYVLTAPIHTYTTTGAFLPELDGHPPLHAAGERFTYCNGGFMVLALIAERATGEPYHDLVQRTVIEPAGLRDTAYLRSDELPGDAAIGYLHPPDHSDRLRSNVLHLPVLGNGDGGAYTSARDLVTLWSALFAGRIVDPEWVDAMTRPVSDETGEGLRYGIGMWVHLAEPVPIILGGDAGAMMVSAHDPRRRRTYTVLSNRTNGAWPVAKALLALAGRNR